MRSNEKSIHINRFKNAFLNVAPEYFKIQALNNRFQIIERAFAYELYHQLRQEYNGENWYVNGELNKGLLFLPAYGNDNTYILDLVVHHHATTENNLIAVEIKTNPKVNGSEIVDDLNKLEIYTRPGGEHLNYQIGIMLIINSNFKEKLVRMKKDNQKKIIELLKFNRIAIWNIDKPNPIKKSNTNSQLNSDCLEIIRYEDLIKTLHNNV